MRIALVLLAACTASDDIHAPAIGAVTPDHATPGTIVVVDGSYFCQQPDMPDDPLACANTGTVLFGTLQGSTDEWTDASIMVEVPQGPSGSVQVSVSVAGRVSNTVSFTID